MPAMQSGLALQCRRHKGKKKKVKREGGAQRRWARSSMLETGEERSRGGGEKASGEAEEGG